MSIVFTALYGGYETLNEQPMALASTAQFICLTDDPDLRSDTWNVRYQPARFPGDPVRSARAVKIRASEVWDGEERSLWIDNRVELRQNPDDLLDQWLGDRYDIALPLHSYRSSVRAEFGAVLSLGYDRAEAVREQRHALQTFYPEVLDQQPFWTGMVARLHQPPVSSSMALWMDWVLRYSRRDQLSINLALSSTGARVHAVSVDNYESEWHKWLQVEKRASILFDSDAYRYGVGRHLADLAARKVSMARHHLFTMRRRRRGEIR